MSEFGFESDIIDGNVEAEVDELSAIDDGEDIIDGGEKELIDPETGLEKERSLGYRIEAGAGDGEKEEE